MSEPAGLSPRAQRLDAQRLRITSPDLAWNARVRSSILAVGASDLATSAYALSGAQAALEVGEFAVARKLIECSRDQGIEYLRLIALYSRWCGELGFLKREWPHVIRLAFGSPPTSVLADLGLAAEAIGAQVDAKLLQAAARTGAPPRPPLRDDQDPFIALHQVVFNLQIEPDAPRGRLSMRLALPPSWDALTLERLRMGDAELNVRLTRAGATHSFRFEPVSGPIPIRLILALIVPGTRLTGVAVDGAPAQLDVLAPEPEVLSCPIQIVLDHPRSVEITAQ